MHERLEGKSVFGTTATLTVIQMWYICFVWHMGIVMCFWCWRHLGGHKFKSSNNISETGHWLL